MSVQDREQALLLALLNSTPVVDGIPTDRLADARGAAGTRSVLGVDVPDGERDSLVEAREALQGVVRGDLDTSVLAPLLHGVRRTPGVEGDRIAWVTDVPPARRLAVRAILAWDDLQRRSPGRLRPCANDECALFFVDSSRPGVGRWCSMARCGNRMKARRHHARSTGRAVPLGGEDPEA